MTPSNSLPHLCYFTLLTCAAFPQYPQQGVFYPRAPGQAPTSNPSSQGGVGHHGNSSGTGNTSGNLGLSGAYSARPVGVLSGSGYTHTQPPSMEEFPPMSRNVQMKGSKTPSNVRVALLLNLELTPTESDVPISSFGCQRSSAVILLFAEAACHA